MNFLHGCVHKRNFFPTSTFTLFVKFLMIKLQKQYDNLAKQLLKCIAT